jgi:lysozyme
MGVAGVNDRGLYDDAMMLITPNLFMACNANVDPTAQQGLVTGRASLQPGFWPMWKLDLHKGKYLAFCQRASDCVVRRDNTETYKTGHEHPKYGECLGRGLWRGWFGINGHRGGVNTTSSEGCQTVPEPQYSGLIAAAESEARRIWGAKWRQGVIPYLLVEHGK